ncbi:hypothetical protein [Belnapia rosea]|uniref:hypothetical protein n=1 Tax=Belnapia rosea TaxID=938405 RepID=UPI0008820401|nr:hypothetical protein [Belnapia rosea]SDB17297.1 hypothetical protein SAMN02927895_00625 [Belnapia rosea]
MRPIGMPALTFGAQLLGSACQVPPMQDSKPGIAADTGLGAAAGARPGSLPGKLGWGALTGTAAGIAGGCIYERDQRNG